jgi:hypothetical protein
VIRAELVDTKSLTAVWNNTYRSAQADDEAVARDIAEQARARIEKLR